MSKKLRVFNKMLFNVCKTKEDREIFRTYFIGYISGDNKTEIKDWLRGLKASSQFVLGIG